MGKGLVSLNGEAGLWYRQGSGRGTGILGGVISRRRDIANMPGTDKQGPTSDGIEETQTGQGKCEAGE